jgi:hypothetical protein
MHFEDDVVRRVLHHRDLFENHPALQLEIALAQRRAEHQIENHIGGLREMLIEHPRLIRRMLAPRVGVE